MFKEFISLFDSNINGLREFIELIGPVVNHNHQLAIKEQEKVTTSFDIAVEILNTKDKDEKNKLEAKIKALLNGELVIAKKVKLEKEDKTDNDEDIVVMVPATINSKVEEIMNAPNKTNNQKQLLYKNSLIGLLSSVEWFYSQVLHFYYDRYPSAAGIKKKTLTLEELKTFKNINDAEKYLIDNKIEDIFRGGFENWIQILKEEVGLKINFINKYRDELIEIYQRRNILVHNGGIINSIYFAKVSESLIADKKIGDKIDVTEEYLETSICKLHLVFILIACELWKKLEPKEDKRGLIINKIIYSNLLCKRWFIAEGLSEFTSHDNKLSSVITTVGKLNYWLSKKRLGKYSEIQNEVESADFTDKAMRYQLGLLALKSDKVNFFFNLKEALKSKSLTVDELLEYPIFEDMRNTEEFIKFKETAPEFKEFINFDPNADSNDNICDHENIEKEISEESFDDSKDK